MLISSVLEGNPMVAWRAFRIVFIFFSALGRGKGRRRPSRWRGVSFFTPREKLYTPPPPLPPFLAKRHFAGEGGGGVYSAPSHNRNFIPPPFYTPPTPTKVFSGVGGWRCIKLGPVLLKIERKGGGGCARRRCGVYGHREDVCSEERGGGAKNIFFGAPKNAPDLPESQFALNWEMRNIYHHTESKKRKSLEANSGSIHPYGRYGNAVKTRKTISTIAILWPVKAIFEKRAATVEVDTLISPAKGGHLKGGFRCEVRT